MDIARHPLNAMTSTPTIHSDLVYDIGLHKGEDTAFYLRLGYRVVAFEANPDLVAQCKRRFATEIERGQLTIISGAITYADAPSCVPFFRNEKTVWGTTSSAWVERNRDLGRVSDIVMVKKVIMTDVLLTYGVPHYLKIDVEGADRLVVETITALQVVPEFISIETEKVSFDLLVVQIEQLEALGYRRFKVVQQATIPYRTRTIADLHGRMIKYRFEPHSSGPFGNQIAGEWLDRNTVIKRYQRIFGRYRTLGDASLVGRYGRIVTRPLEFLFAIGLPGWHDLHATR
jgi:FkbM family methyltransferase